MCKDRFDVVDDTMEGDRAKAVCSEHGNGVGGRSLPATGEHPHGWGP